MSLIMEILNELSKKTFYYKGIPMNILGVPKFKSYKSASLRTTTHRLQQRGLIKKESGGWILTSIGSDYLKKKQDSLRQFRFNFPKSAPKNLIVMFDIPETKKVEREWFRFQLKKGGYVMIQKSVWVGPSPLPVEFMAYVKKIGLKKNIKTFKLAKAYLSD